MNPELITICEDRLFEYLNGKNLPVMEHDIIKYFFPPGTGQDEQHTLYVKHFSLYHALYKLKFSAGAYGFYLHLDCMRIRLIRLPEASRCGHYYPETGSFCMEVSEDGYCALHNLEVKNSRNNVTFDILQDFYTDRENITFGDSELLKKLMSGIKTYSFRKKDVDEALKFFGIHEPGKKRITRRYRELAAKYHPDIPGGSEEMMKRLNGCYIILKDVFIL